MALSSGILALSIIGVLVTGIVTVVATIAIYLCAKVAVQVYLRQDGSNGAERDATPFNGGAGGNTARDVDEAEVEMGTMSFFIEGVQNERPVRFSSTQLRGFTQGFSHRVGSGGFGVVYKGRFPNGAPVAVKVLNSTLGRRAEEQFMAEVGTIGRTYHINLVRLYGFCFDASVKALVYEYMENGSLDRHLFGSTPETAIGSGKLHEIAVGTGKAVRYLHEECQHRIIHYDIKPENVLLGAGMAPKVSDFGLAKLCDREDTHLTITGARGTPGYAAPELWLPLPVTHKCDVYSYGMLLFEMLGRRRNLELGLHGRHESQEWYPRWVWHRFEAGDMDAVLARAMAAGDVDDMEKAARMCKVALWCVQYRPEDRPSMGNVVRMLEGEEDIATPGNPFAHMAPYSAGAMLSDDTTTESNASSDFIGRVPGLR
ncbi:LEAF RUST 10 DISEASE-RESISTANCE LOCUS RECEPTOR-LIKE PROTEIN KINASE-like 2.2 isoform X1 [Lolium rigidum]|uniref:LEAF RUST 10 DISEASE-RESISTANCE LOCUS RECEPTOR-LIKE PROTEIN KINASE-like 2.2 isoform X1 n=1 Tax=Lolium rigidum TaxID=89674 RepID=UPI001F5D6095|nr:LEAF RUST 10 DISEASE-RESISTANCE LOCUS RECEPTOR-LIKE PROTEIN KINASE-like 2.2 isoform X1 [Lolium rigidum]